MQQPSEIHWRARRGSRSDCGTPPLGFPSGAAGRWCWQGPDSTPGAATPCLLITCAPARASKLSDRCRRGPRCLPMKATPYHGVSLGPGTWRIPTSISQCSSCLLLFLKLCLEHSGASRILIIVFSPLLPAYLAYAAPRAAAHQSFINTYYVAYLNCLLFAQDTATQSSSSHPSHTCCCAPPI